MIALLNGFSFFLLFFFTLSISLFHFLFFIVSFSLQIHFIPFLSLPSFFFSFSLTSLFLLKDSQTVNSLILKYYFTVRMLPFTNLLLLLSIDDHSARLLGSSFFRPFERERDQCVTAPIKVAQTFFFLLENVERGCGADKHSGRTRQTQRKKT